MSAPLPSRAPLSPSVVFVMQTGSLRRDRRPSCLCGTPLALAAAAGQWLCAHCGQAFCRECGGTVARSGGCDVCTVCGAGNCG